MVSELRQASELQFEALRIGQVPAPEKIGSGLWCVPMPMVGESLHYTLSLVHEGPLGELAIIDPGWDSDDALDRWAGFLGTIGHTFSDVEWIIGTHGHADHIGIADRLRAATGAPLVLGKREQAALDLGPIRDAKERAVRLIEWGVPAETLTAVNAQYTAAAASVPVPGTADILLDDGDLLPVDGVRWRAVLTAGHTAGHMCFADETRRLLFAGDHVLPTVFPGIGLGPTLDSDPISDYLRSLARLEPYDDWEVVPAHGYRFRALNARRRATHQHVLRRAHEVSEALGRQPGADTWELASQLTWGPGWEQVSRGKVLFSALSQTSLYRGFVEADGLSCQEE